MSHRHQDLDTQRWHDDGGALHPDERDVGHVELPPEAAAARRRAPRTGSHVPVTTTADVMPERREVIQADTTRFGR